MVETSKGCLKVKKIFFLIPLALSFISCNVIQTLTDGETKLEGDFFNESSEEYVNTQLLNGLFAFWRMDEAATGSSKIDLQSGLSLSDTTAGMPSTSGVHGNAIDCSTGTSGSSLLDLSTSFNKSLADDYAFSFWIYMPANPSGGCADTNTVINFTGGTIAIDDLDCAGTADVNVTIGVSNAFNDVVDFTGGSWHHFVINVITGATTIGLYIDGNFVANSTGTNTAITSGYIAVCSRSDGTQTFGGKLDSLGIWNRTLSSTEISDLYQGNNSLDN